MTKIHISKETKAKLVAEVQACRPIPDWFFQFLPADEAFQNELFRLAESVNNAPFFEAIERRLNRLKHAFVSLRQKEEKRNILPTLTVIARPKRRINKTKVRLVYRKRTTIASDFRPAGLSFDHYARTHGIFVPERIKKGIWIHIYEGGAPGLGKRA
ncbi:MAG: hypothetical protein WC378_05145 [Opitutaceae bacterium]|jgi:hypothetical protein